MVFERNINGIDQCEPPICPDNTELIVLTYPESVSVGGLITVTFTIDNNDITPTSTILNWALNSSLILFNIETATLSGNYIVNFLASSSSGLLYFRCKSVIQNSIYYNQDDPLLRIEVIDGPLPPTTTPPPPGPTSPIVTTTVSPVLPPTTTPEPPTTTVVPTIVPTTISPTGIGPIFSPVSVTSVTGGTSPLGPDPTTPEPPPAAAYMLTPCVGSTCGCASTGGFDDSQPMTVSPSGITTCGAVCTFPNISDECQNFTNIASVCTWENDNDAELCDPSADASGTYTVFVLVSAGDTVMTVWIKSGANRIFEGSKTLTAGECAAGTAVVSNDLALVDCDPLRIRAYGGTCTVTWTPLEPRCPGGSVIYTDTDLSGCVGKVIELNDNVCYEVAVNETSNPTDGEIIAVDSFDDCSDACDDASNRGFPCP